MRVEQADTLARLTARASLLGRAHGIAIRRGRAGQLHYERIQSILQPDGGPGPERKGNWSYVFFIDFDGHLSEQRVEKVLQEVGEIALSVRFLGSYPKALLQE